MPGLLATPKHPAPVPDPPSYPGVYPGSLPPKLALKGSKVPTELGGLILKWDKCGHGPTAFSKFEIFYYKETDATPDTSLWTKMGDVNVSSLPLAVYINSLTHSVKYYFSVRAVDMQNRRGPFSDPVGIVY